ncbi:MAG TPA: BON domain-containing protein [Ktedonobacterales bacterium]|nr:BON domain-containing protein [Ktedonobacterales bacterium]
MATSSVDVLKFRFGTVVIASDGEAGNVAYVAVQPGQRAVTHVGVKLPGGHTVAVPLDRVTEGASHELRVTLTREGLLQAMQPASAEATLLSRNTQVNAGKLRGSLTQVSMTTQTQQVRHLTVKPGLGGEQLLSANWITEISDDGKAINVAIPAGVEPAPYRSDTDLHDEAHDRLWNYARLRVDLRTVEIRAIDGEIWLRGFVSSTLNRRIITELLTDLKGLTAIHNDLVADNELAVTIARALSQDPRTHSEHIGVYPSLGTVFLRGLANTETVRDVATQIAATVAPNAKVVNQIAAGRAGSYIPMLAPVTGTEDIVPGGD